MKEYSVNKVYIAACIGLAMFGVAMLSLGAILPPLIKEIPQATSLPQYMSIGIIIGTLIFGPTMDRFGYKSLLISGSIVLLAGLSGLAIFSDMTNLIISIILVGLGGGILNGETNAIVSEIIEDPKKRGAKLSLLGACYCIGALLWTLLCTFISDYKIPLYGVAVFMIIYILYLLSIKFPKGAKNNGEKISIKKTFSLFTYGGLLFIAFVLFFQSGLEGISGSYFPTFFVSSGVEINLATFSLTMFTIGMLLGRLALSQLMNRFKDTIVLLIYLIIGLLGFVLITLQADVVSVIYTGMVLVGFGVGATYPVLLSHLGNAFRGMSGTAFSVAIFIALCGQYIFNFIGGKLFSSENWGVFPFVLISTLLIIIILYPFAVKTIDKTNFK